MLVLEAVWWLLLVVVVMGVHSGIPEAREDAQNAALMG